MVVLTLVGKLRKSLTSEGQKEESGGKGLIVPNLWSEWDLCASHVFLYSCCFVWFKINFLMLMVGNSVFMVWFSCSNS